MRNPARGYETPDQARRRLERLEATTGLDAEERRLLTRLQTQEAHARGSLDPRSRRRARDLLARSIKGGRATKRGRRLRTWGQVPTLREFQHALRGSKFNMTLGRNDEEVHEIIMNLGPITGVTVSGRTVFFDSAQALRDYVQQGVDSADALRDVEHGLPALDVDSLISSIMQHLRFQWI